MAKKKLTVNLKTETKSEKFKRLGTPRLKKAIKSISLLENLCSSNYEHTPEQSTYITNKLLEAVERISTKLNAVKAEVETEKIEL